MLQLAEGQPSWGIPWPCIHEFLAITTHRRIYSPPTTVDRAIDQVSVWLESPSLVMLAETVGYGSVLTECLLRAKITGPQVHDARIAALCVHHGVRELWSADRDFSRFSGLRVRNPLVAS